MYKDFGIIWYFYFKLVFFLVKVKFIIDNNVKNLIFCDIIVKVVFFLWKEGIDGNKMIIILLFCLNINILY